MADTLKLNISYFTALLSLMESLMITCDDFVRIRINIFKVIVQWTALYDLNIRCKLRILIIFVVFILCLFHVNIEEALVHSIVLIDVCFPLAHDFLHFITMQRKIGIENWRNNEIF